MKPRILKEAEKELLEAANYYEQHRDGLGLEFCDRVADTVVDVIANPKSYSVYEAAELSCECRCASVSRFPYIIVYELTANELLIVAVAHTSREPGYWDARNSGMNR